MYGYGHYGKLGQADDTKPQSEKDPTASAAPVVPLAPPPAPARPAPTPVSFATVKNDVELNHRLNELHIELFSVVKRATNFVLRKFGPAYKKWDAIGSDIQKAELTSEARAKLVYRHKLFEPWVTPKPFSLLQALLPFVAVMLVKSFVGGKLHERKIESILTRKRDGRRDKQKAEKALKRKEKESTPAPPARAKRKAKRRAKAT